MSAVLNVRLSESVYRTPEERAAVASMPLPDYARKILVAAATRPTPTEFDERIDHSDDS